MEIEDFGNNTLVNFLKRTKNKFNLYKKCVDILFKIQKIKPIKKTNKQIYEIIFRFC